MPPLWLERATCSDLDPPDELGALAVRDRHVVLRFASYDEASLREAIDHLRRALAEHSVFLSGVDTITVLRVIARAEIERHRAAITDALAAYRHTCAELVEHYQNGSLDPAWDTGEHGMECRFEHRATGQIVEASLQSRLHRVDPYFFALFVQSTPEWRHVAELIVEEFHDAARMIDVIGDI
jgi:hypothetical protein